jgi:hypothetical protein
MGDCVSLRSDVCARVGQQTAKPTATATPHPCDDLFDSDLVAIVLVIDGMIDVIMTIEEVDSVQAIGDSR